jgi:hypothetical protein
MFLADHKDAIAAIDTFVVPTTGFRLLHGFVILHLGRRELVGKTPRKIPLPSGLSGRSVKPFPGKRSAEVHASGSRRLLWRRVWGRRLDAIRIRERSVAPRSPWQNGYVRLCSARSGESAPIRPSSSAKSICAGRSSQITRVPLQPGAGRTFACRRRSHSSADPSAREFVLRISVAVIMIAA